MMARCFPKHSWLVVYNVVLVCLSPFFVLLKLLYWARKGPVKHYDWMRWTGGPYRCRQKDPNRVRLVYMCLSYGEAVLAEALHAKLIEAGLPVEGVYAIRDRNELQRFQKASGAQVLPYPFDFWIPFARWHRNAQPDIVVFIEKFFFGNVAIGSKLRGARVLAINARANRRTKPLRKLISFHYPAVVRSFDWIGARTEEHAERIRRMAPDARNVEAVGNFKSGVPIKPIPEPQMASLRQWVGEARFPTVMLAAGSLDGPEEIAFVLQAFADLRKGKEASLLVAPRHLSDAEAVVSQAAALGFSCSRRTAPVPGADVLVLDTLGELAQAYQFAIGTFIGGTVTGAGHNVIEPLHWGVPVSYGPVRGHFQDLQLLCEEKGIGFRLASPEELARYWLRLVEDPALREELRSKIGPVLAGERRGFELTVERVAEFVKRRLSNEPTSG